MEQQVYRVKDWNRHYENNRSRVLKNLEWLPVPNRLDNDGYIELVMHPNGPAHLGAWLAILQVASRCKPRGVLIRDSLTPHSPESISRITRIPPDLISDAIGRLTAPEIGWLEIVPIQQALAEIRHDDAGIRQGGDVDHVNERKKERRNERRHTVGAQPDFLEVNGIPGVK